MQYYCEQSENSRLIVERFVETCSEANQLFLSGPKGSEFHLLIKEYCNTQAIDTSAVISLEPNVLEESMLGELMVTLSQSAAHPEILLIRVDPGLDEISEAKLMKFLNNPAFKDSKFIIILEDYDPFEETNPYSQALSEYSKSSLFVLPPLKTRAADLAQFSLNLLDTLEKKSAVDAPIRLSEGAMELMLEYEWPGNYEELKEVLRTLVSGSKRGGVISRDRLVEVLNHGRKSPVE